MAEVKAARTEAEEAQHRDARSRAADAALARQASNEKANKPIRGAPPAERPGNDRDRGGAMNVRRGGGAFL